ncbi:MAG: 2-C-methyl-D-erythritol 4-phosphate cytidylyltransferase [Rhodoferax sp.]
MTLPTRNTPASADGAPPRLWALLPCAGAGLRAGGAQPKQYQPLAGRPLVLHTLAAFAGVARLAGTMVVISPQDNVLPALADGAPWQWAACGGATRAQTVLQGLGVLLQRGAQPQDWVLVHDAARCLITPALIERLIDACLADPVGGLLAHPVADTLKLGREGRVLETTDRRDRWLAQTPQMFRIGLLQAALQAAGESVTDESSAIEVQGLSPRLVPGSSQNFKVTFPEDFQLAQAVLQARASTNRQERPDYDYP